MALVRAAGYFYVDRYNLVLAKDGVVDGAGYTDVHVRLPAIELLAVVALAVFVLMVFNVYQRSLALPAIGAGLWVLVALTAGVIVPAAVQALKVTPAQSTLEMPYISRNISATRAAMGPRQRHERAVRRRLEPDRRRRRRGRVHTGQPSAVGAVDHVADLPEAPAERHGFHHRRPLPRPLPRSTAP